MQTKIVIVIIVILIIILVYLNTDKNKDKTERFDYYSKCTNCNNKSYQQCLNCENCGTCVTEFGDMYCTKGNEDGSFERTDCYKWHYGNIYPQYNYRYYDALLLTYPNDARFYPYLKTLDEKHGTKYFTENYLNKLKNFYAQFNNSLRPELYYK